MHGISEFFRQKWRNIGQRLAVLVLPVGAFLLSLPAAGATIIKVNAEHDKLLLSLTPAELAFVANDEKIWVEVNYPRIVAVVTFTKFNASKRTVVAELPEWDDRFEARQQLRFLPMLFNVASSPLITSAAQYSYGSRAIVEGGLGGFIESSKEYIGTARGTQTAKGARLTAHGYLILDSRYFGFNFDYEHRVATAKLKPVGQSSTMSMHLDQLSPSAWVEFSPGWRLGLRYDYTVIVQAYSGDERGNYQFSVGRPIATLLWSDGDTETGLDVSAEHNAGAVASYTETKTRAYTYEARLYKVPTEIFAHYRSIVSPFFGWGFGAGYLLINRTPSAGKTLDAPATLPEVVRFRLGFEERLANGDKYEWAVTYDGGKTRGLSTLERKANEIGLQGTYQSLVGNKWICGATADLAGGSASFGDRSIGANGEKVEVNRVVVGVRTSFLAFANYALDPLLKKGRR